MTPPRPVVVRTHTTYIALPCDICVMARAAARLARPGRREHLFNALSVVFIMLDNDRYSSFWMLFAFPTGLCRRAPPHPFRSVHYTPVMSATHQQRWCGHTRAAAPFSRPIFPRSRSPRGCSPRDHARTQPGPAAWPHTAWPRSLAHAARFQACRPAGTSPARFLRRPYARAQVRKWHGLAPGPGFTCLVK